MSDTDISADQGGTLFGHPTGLFTLFFAEMWERFSYYGMRALLVFYMVKGFLKFTDGEAYAVYGAYTALVYATPFIGGMLADRILGARRAVVLGGILMAAGHLVMTQENAEAFYLALALLIVGNGFFKPNISTMVGALYKDGDVRRDGGFTIFYIGINLGAAMAPLLCGYVGETYGWHYGFGLATGGMLIGLAVFVAPTIVTQILIGGGAVSAAYGMTVLPDNPYLQGTGAAVSLALLASAGAAIVALGKGGLPSTAGAPKNPEFLKKASPIGLSNELAVYLGSAIAVIAFYFLVKKDELAGGLLSVFGVIAFGYLIYYTINSPRITRERLYVVLILTFFSMLFWAFFEQAGSSVNNFTDRNVDRVFEERTLGDEDMGKTITFEVTQEQLGFTFQDKFTPVFYTDFLERIWAAEKKAADKDTKIERAKHGHIERELMVTVAHVGMKYLVPAKSAKDGAESKKEVKVIKSDDVGKTMTIPWGARQLGYSINGKELDVKALKEALEAEFAAAKKEKRKVKPLVTELKVEKDHVGMPIGDGDLVENTVTTADVGKSIKMLWSQRQLGHVIDNLFTIDQLDSARDKEKELAKESGTLKPAKIERTLTVNKAYMGMGIATLGGEIPASTFQSINPMYILIFGLIFTFLWAFLAKKGLEPSTPIKFALGLLQLGLGFFCFYQGAASADVMGMGALSWLLLGYLLQTTGELCLSPVGLSMVTKLSPKAIVSTVMGVWFLATAFSNYLAGMIAKLTGVEHGDSGSVGTMPAPIETVNIYGGVFKSIAIAACVSAVICFALAPLLSKWMHEGEESDEDQRVA